MGQVKLMLKVLPYLFFGILFCSIFIVGKIFLNNDTPVKNLCYEYEDKGYIPRDSCSCAEKLHKNWAESYDWMDACAIVHAREKIKVK